MKKFREIPQPTYEKDAERITKYYQLAFSEIHVRLLKFLALGKVNDITIQHEASLLRQIRQIIGATNQTVKEEIDTLIRKAFTDAQVEALFLLEDFSTKEEARKHIKFSSLITRTAETLVDDTFQDLLEMTQRTEYKIKSAVRQVVAHQMRLKAMQNIGRKGMTKAIYNELLSKGFDKQVSDADNWIGITDRAGRKWDLKKYVQMVVRTKGAQAHSEGVRSEAAERNVDLAIISAHNAEDECQFFEHMVISMSGATENYLSYDEIRSSNKCFHPNCRHHVSPVRKWELVPRPIQEQHLKNIDKAKKLVRG